MSELGTAFELVNGPQDGAKVQQCVPVMPQTIYVGPKWRGDGYAAWGTERSDRFPSRYVLDGYVFVFRELERSVAHGK